MPDAPDGDEAEHENKARGGNAIGDGKEIGQVSGKTICQRATGYQAGDHNSPTGHPGQQRFLKGLIHVDGFTGAARIVAGQFAVRFGGESGNHRRKEKGPGCEAATDQNDFSHQHIDTGANHGP